MTTSRSDEIWQRAVGRWAEITAESPDLTPAVTLQQGLLRLTLNASAQIDVPLPVSLTPEAVAEKWQRGLPALRNQHPAIPDCLKQLLPAIGTLVAEAGAADSALHIRDALVAGDIDAESLLRVSLARNQKAVRTSALHMGFSPDLVWLIGELATAPLAHHLQQQVMRMMDVRIRLWDRGYCACCGSWPVLIESIHGSRRLRCSYCALDWQLATRRCLYCGNAGSDFVVAAPDPNRAERRLELCAACGSYTKTIDAAQPSPFPLLAIEDLATIDLDRAAMERGYRRPDLFDLDSIERPEPRC